MVVAAGGCGGAPEELSPPPMDAGGAGGGGGQVVALPPPPGRDGGPDAAPQPDAGLSCEACVPSSPCVTAACVLGECVETPVDDGLLCGEGTDLICVAGGCVTRGCGEGYREPGPDPAREQCDDGNASSDDHCTSECKAQEYRADPSATGDFATRPGAQESPVGVDGEGRILMVWIHDTFGDEAIHARRFTSAGAPVVGTGDERIVLADGLGTPSNAAPQVAGLESGGWVVTWSAPQSGSREILFRTVGVDGSLGAVLRANISTTGNQTDPSIAAFGGGFVVAWETDVDTLDDPDGGVLARRFDAQGLPRTGEIVLDTDRDATERAVRLAASGETWAATWARAVIGEAAEDRVVVRRLDSLGAIETAPFPVADERADQPAIAGGASGAYAVAFRAFGNDAGGDIAAVAITAAGAIDGSPMPVASAPAETEEQPSVALTPAGELVVAYRYGFPADYAYWSSGALPPESAGLDATLALHAQGALTVKATPRGLFFAWTGTGLGTSSNSFTTFLLAFD